MIPLRDNVTPLGYPVVTLALIALNVVVYLLAILHGGSILAGPTPQTEVAWGAIPYEFTHPGTHCQLVATSAIPLCQAGPTPSQPATWLTALTQMFMHASLLHIAGNMIFLWVFGRTVEGTMGPVRFALFYILGGLAALGLELVISPNSQVPYLGASGAISAVLGGYLVLYPRARVLTLIFLVFFVTVFDMPALAMIGIWFLLNALIPALGQLGQTVTGGVAYFEHVGGFIFGVLLIRAFAQRVAEPAQPLESRT